MVEGIAKEKRLIIGNKKISDSWWRQFVERQLQLTLRKGDLLIAAVRLASTTAET